MKIFQNLFLLCIYLLVAFTKMISKIFKFDLLRRKKVVGKGSYWVERKIQPFSETYFLQCQMVEQSHSPSRPMISWISKLLTSFRRPQSKSKLGVKKIGSRDEIPDETYTLW